jgi:hypothetical protein
MIYTTLLEPKNYVVYSFEVQVVSEVRLDTNISDGNRIFFQVSPHLAFLNTNIICM